MKRLFSLGVIVCALSGSAIFLGAIPSLSYAQEEPAPKPDPAPEPPPEPTPETPKPEFLAL
jgi:hypothetical protein